MEILELNYLDLEENKNYEIIENSRNIIFYDYKPFKQNKYLY